MQVLCGIHTPKRIYTMQLESVQQLALKICSHCWDIDYHILLDMFTLPTLASRREYLRILTLFKIINGCFYFPPNVYYFQLLTPSKPVPTKKKPCIYTVPFSRSTLYFKSSFVLRTLCVWNSLGDHYTVPINEFRCVLRNLFLLNRFLGFT